MKIITIATILMLPLGGLIVALVRRDYRESDGLRPGTVTAVWGLYALHLVLTLSSAWMHTLTLPVPLALRLAGGLPLVIAGAGLALAGTAAFGSFDLMSGRSTDHLVVSTVYRFSRNPQNVGWIMALLGISWLGGTGLGMIQAVIFWALFAGYVGYEEAFLTRMYGDRYLAYCQATPRFLGRAKLATDSGGVNQDD